MDKENLTKIHEKLLEIHDFIYILKIALDNLEQPNSDTRPYAVFAGMVQENITKILDEF